MGAGALVDEARGWARDLLRAETRGWGDRPQAMRRLARRLGVPWRAIEALLYRPPKSIGAEIYLALAQAARGEGEAADDLQRRSDEIGDAIAALRAELAELRQALAR